MNLFDVRWSDINEDFLLANMKYKTFIFYQRKKLEKNKKS